eukprot:gene28693-34641_t
MTEVNQEFFIRKAEQDYHAAWREKEREREKVFEESYLERRAREAGWLIKIEKPPENDKLRPKTAPKQNEGVEYVSSMQNVRSSISPKPSLAKIFKRKPTKDEIAAQQKLQEAETLKEADRSQKRELYLQNSVKQIRVLERVIRWLSVPRQPAHHVKLPEVVNEQSELEKERNLRCYTIPKPTPIIEPLKSIEQVMAEEREAQRHKVGGRYHMFRGEGKVYPLRIFPSTLEVCLPPNPQETPPVLPEDALLPDKNAIRRKKEEAEKKRKERRRKVVRIKTDQLDLSRKVVERRGEADEEEGMRKNPQFTWRDRVPPDDNSVYTHPHPQVIFHSPSRSLSPSIKEESVAESSVYASLPSSAHYSILPHVSAERSVVNDIQKVGRIEGSMTGSLAGTMMTSAWGSAGDAPMATMRNSVVASGSTIALPKSNTVNDGWSLASEEQSWGSARGVRDNTFSVGSACTQTLIPVPMERHRRIHGLDRFKVKLKLNLMSLRKKEKILKSLGDS